MFFGIRNRGCVLKLLFDTAGNFEELRMGAWGGSGSVLALSKCLEYGGPFTGDLGVALYDEGLPRQQSLMKETSLLVQTALFVTEEDPYTLLRVNQRLNNFCRKGCPGREAQHSRPI